MSIRLIIAEKPNAAKAIAGALAGGEPSKNADGIFIVNDDRIVACAGHILEQYDPQDYDEKYKTWRIEDLPIHPEDWKLKPSREDNKKRMLAMIKKGAAGVDEIIHAGDIDAEGQLLVDEVIHYLKWSGITKRLLISDLNPEPIRKAFNNLKPNQDFARISERALTRSRADWLLGMNCSRLYSKLADKVGVNATLSVGRVQSAVLGLVARRDLEIKNFKTHDFYTVNLAISHENGEFTAKWKPHESQTGLDEEGRLIDGNVLEALKQQVPASVSILNADTTRKNQKPPLPFSLSDLQKAANQKLGLDMQTVLDIAQKLYDKDHLITYPRTDTGYLPEDQFHAAGKTLTAVGKNLENLRDAIEKANPDQKSRAYNDKKVSAHHGIVPTELADSDTVTHLSKDERAIYEMVCQRYVAQFHPDAVFDATEIVVGLPDGQGEQFVSRGKIWIAQGWREVLDPNGASEEDEENGEGDNNSDDAQSLPAVKAGDSAKGTEILSDQKKTTAPKPYTDSTLLTAMTKIHRFVTNPDTKKNLRENDGIGTEATRAGIVKKLIDHHKHLKREKKYIRVTTNGALHYRLMPAELSTPDMAGTFEAALREVENGNFSMDAFLQQMDAFVRSQLDVAAQEQWLEQARKIAPQARPSEFKCRHCQKPLYERHGKTAEKKRLLYFVCQAGDCGCHFRSDNGAPTSCFKGPLQEKDDADIKQQREEKLAASPKCPECNNPLWRYKKKGGDFHFWRCQDFQGTESCDSVYADDENTPGKAFVIRGDKVEAKPDGPLCPVCQEADTFRGKTRKDKRPLIICKACDSMAFATDEGEPGEVFKRRGEMAKRAPDGPPCPVCDAEHTICVKSKEKQTPLWICEACDSMGMRDENGAAQEPFKIKGKMKDQKKCGGKAKKKSS
jgi:DNA topoisomerase-3